MVGTSARTLRCDLKRLEGLGYEVEGRPGPGGHYRLGAGTRLPPMVFDDAEVVALVAGLRMAEQGPTSEAASRALVKLRQVLPRRLPPTGRSASVTPTSTAPPHGGAWTRCAACLLVGGRWHVLAFDPGRDDWRLFRLDRMREVAEAGPAPRRDPPAEDVATWLRTDFGRSG